MTNAEFDEMAALVVRLRKDLELHTDALRQSNAQCSKLLVQNEQLTAELDRMKGDPLPIKLVGKLKDVETSNKTLHSELVEVRAALATVSEERDSLQRTLDEWSNADTEPHDRVTADDDVADHVVPPILHVGEPDPANDAKDAKLEFRNVVPTPEMIAHVGYWDLVSGAAAIAFRSGGLRIVFWRIAGSQEWRTDPCPQPLKPHGMTWQQLDRALANTKSVPPVLPLCMKCHGCGGTLEQSANGPYYWCSNFHCIKQTTKDPQHPESPLWGACNSKTPVRHHG
jgi:hypothetical protein